MSPRLRDAIAKHPARYLFVQRLDVSRSLFEEALGPRSARDLVLQDPQLDGAKHRSGPVTYPELAKDARRLILHRRFGGAECDGDLSVALSCGDESQDVELALGERDGDGRGGNAGREAGEATNDALGDGRVDERPSRRDGAHGLGELFERDVFEEEAASAELYRFDRNRVVVERREEDAGRA